MTERKISYSVLVLVPLLAFKGKDSNETPVITAESLKKYKSYIEQICARKLMKISFLCSQDDKKYFTEDYVRWICTCIRENGEVEYSFRGSANNELETFKRIILSTIPEDIKEILLSEDALSSFGIVEKRKILRYN